MTRDLPAFLKPRQNAWPHKGDAPSHEGGDQARKAQEWGGGNKGAKGSTTQGSKQNQNSSAKS